MRNLMPKFGCFILPLLIVFLASCVRTPPPVMRIPEVGGQIGAGYGQMIVPKKQGRRYLRNASHRAHQPAAHSTIDGQLQDGGWVMNLPGKAHTHRVVLAECPQQPLVVTHVHNEMQAEQLGKGPHKHKGCYICPPKNSLVKRVLGG